MQNVDDSIETELCNCLVHARRNFYDLVNSYPSFAGNVIKEMAPIFALEQEVLEKALSPAQRLSLHQERSLPILENIKKCCKEAMDTKVFEPNSAMGKAIAYLFRHWDKLIKFTQIEGAPIHSNDIERGLKTQVLSRKNSLFFKTENGALVGTILSSIIETTKAENLSVFDYLKTLMTYSKQVSQSPEAWLPWNYKIQVEHLGRTT
jgi:transposase